MNRGLTLIVLVMAGRAEAQPPSGYSCGPNGKPLKGQGCECPAGKTASRDAENTAVCIPAKAAQAALGIPRRILEEQQREQMQPAISRDLKLLYVSMERPKLFEIRVATGRMQQGALVFDKSSALIPNEPGLLQSEPTWTADGGVLFTQTKGRESWIMSFHPGRVGVTRRYPSKQAQINPGTAPDGALVWAEAKEGGFSPNQIFVQRGADTKVIAQGRTPAFSPDGKRIAFVDDTAMWVMNSDGSNKVQVSTSGGVRPRWHPNGKKIVFTRVAPEPEDDDVPSTGHDIWEINVETKAETQLTKLPGNELAPTYTPDGKSILFGWTSVDRDAQSLWIMRIEN